MTKDLIDLYEFLNDKIKHFFTKYNFNQDTIFDYFQYRLLRILTFTAKNELNNKNLLDNYLIVYKGSCRDYDFETKIPLEPWELLIDTTNIVDIVYTLSVSVN